MSSKCACVFKANPYNPDFCYEISWERPFKDTNPTTKWEVNEFPVRISRLTTYQKAKVFCQKHDIHFPASEYSKV